MQSSTNASDDAKSMKWGERLLADGSDNKAHAVVEFVSKTGACDPAQEWTLVLMGDT